MFPSSSEVPLDSVGLEFGWQLSEESKPEMIQHKFLAGEDGTGLLLFLSHLLYTLNIYHLYIFLYVQNAHLTCHLEGHSSPFPQDFYDYFVLKNLFIFIISFYFLKFFKKTRKPLPRGAGRAVWGAWALFNLPSSALDLFGNKEHMFLL